MDLLTEKISLWDKLVNKDVYLYGLGLGAEKIINVCKIKGISIKNVLINDAQKKFKPTFLGYDVIRLSKALENPNAIILLGFGSQKREVLDHFYHLDDNFEVYAPDVPVFGDGIFDMGYYKKHEHLFIKAYNLLADDISKETFKATLNYKISGKLSYLRNFTQHKDEAFTNILNIGDDEYFVDLGAYTGDTILEILHYGNFKKATAFELDAKNYNKMCNNLKHLTNVDLLNIGAWDKKETLSFAKKSNRNSSLMQQHEKTETAFVDSVDNIMQNNRVTLIKMDVEGAEKQAINGALNTIKLYKPRLNIAIYHRNEDLFDIILRLHEINPLYKFFIRHHEYVPSWDTNLYVTM